MSLPARHVATGCARLKRPRTPARLGSALLIALLGHLWITTALGQAEDPLRAEYQQRLSECRPNDLEARMEVAAWAAARGLTDEAESIYRRILRADPAHDAASAALQRLVARRPLTKDSAPYRSTRRLLPDSFIEYDSRHYVVMSDAEPSWSREQVQRLERAYHQFHRFTRRLRLDPLPVRHRLVCVLFEERDAYRQFARKHDNVSADWIAGYYAPGADRMVFYNVESSPSLTDARGQLESIEDDIGRIRRDAEVARINHRTAEARHLRQTLDLYERHLANERRRVDRFAVQASVATTIHEAVHQLLFHTGIQASRVQYPLWVCEGLATAFEAEQPNRAFGPEYEYAPRREQFTEMLRRDDILPLEELAGLTSLPDNRTSRIEMVYQQSYALIQWMSRHRRSELRDYLQAMQREPAGRPSAARHLQLFEAAFGPAEALHAAWIRDETLALARQDTRNARAAAGVQASPGRP